MAERLIDANALGIGKAKREVFEVPEYADGWNSAIDIIENAPTTEAKPVVHAHWEKDEGFPTCSNCKAFMADKNALLTPYCPYCGAQMDEFVTDTNVGSKTDHIAEVGKKAYCGGAQNG